MTLAEFGVLLRQWRFLNATRLRTSLLNINWSRFFPTEEKSRVCFYISSIFLRCSKIACNISARSSDSSASSHIFCVFLSIVSRISFQSTSYFSLYFLGLLWDIKKTSTGVFEHFQFHWKADHGDLLHSPTFLWAETGSHILSCFGSFWLKHWCYKLLSSYYDQMYLNRGVFWIFGDLSIFLSSIDINNLIERHLMYHFFFLRQKELW